MTPAQRQQIIGEFLRTRSPQAADAAVAAYWPLLRRWTWSYRTTRDGSDDLLQVAAYGLLKSLARFDPRRASFDTYARHCVLGEVRHYMRDHGTAMQVPRSMGVRGKAPVIRSLDELTDGTREGHPSRQIGHDEPGLARAEDRAQLWELFRDLDARQGTALLLCVGFRTPQADVAGILGVPQNTVSRLYTRALRTLRMRAGTADPGDAKSRPAGRHTEQHDARHSHAPPLHRRSWRARKSDGHASLLSAAIQTAIEVRPPGRESPVDSTMSMGRLKLVSAGTVRRGVGRGDDDDPV